MPNKSEVKPVTLNFDFQKETPGTYRFKEHTAAGIPPMVGTLYVQKWALGDEPPQHLTLAIAAS